MKLAIFVSSLFLTSVTAFSGRGTFYSPGTQVGVCGQFIADSDFAVALNTEQFTSSLCGSSITITSGGKTATAVIKDSCPICGTNNLDMTEGLFEFFAPLSTGLIPITWDFV
ncbi:hypothetical protein BDN70DRAFT_854261 [Pholiota conissans]|uniref:RlpA-like protein double-psi beta-barrel domain-containing protein n=1 Tax=Pholiota conissans TaxID=109636 RepID=A0A9P5Z5S5_9AGAR|nr:hypothetical protein BDN70DRAFT_854261 [Pholiota conissans]